MSIRKHRTHEDASSLLEAVAGNGLLHRRALLGRGIMLAGAAATGAGSSMTGAAAEPLANGPWSLSPGVPIPLMASPRNSSRRLCAR
jgi:sulfane dehydrogenase subunit SoxC